MSPRIRFSLGLLLPLLAACQSLPPPAATQATLATKAITATAVPDSDRAAAIALALASQATIPTEPILRIDTGTHIRGLHALSLSPRGNLLATASIDRTVRLWDRMSGEAHAVLRPPMSSLGFGTLYALAFSPDGRELAAGGRTFLSRLPAQPKQAESSIYFFDPLSGGINRTLNDLPGRVHALAWSSSGRQLAVAYAAEPLPGIEQGPLLGSSGIRIYDARALTLLQEIVTDAPCEWLDFDAAQRLFATCRHLLISYDEHGPLRLREAARPTTFRRGALSPDGRRLAVAYAGSGTNAGANAGTHVDGNAQPLAVWSTDDLTPLYDVELPAAEAALHGDLVPAWSPGGNFLYAAGRRQSARIAGNTLFKWDQEGRGAVQRLPADRADIFDLRIRRDGTPLMATSNGNVETLDVRNQLATLIRSDTVDSDNRPDALWVAADGRTVAYSDDDDGRERFVFSHDTRTLLPWADYKNPATLLPPNRQGNPQISGWQLAHRFACNDGTVDLGDSTAQNLAMLRNGQGFAIGTEDQVMFFDGHCRRVWESRTQARAIATQIAEAGGYVISQDEAGVIRWFRIIDGTKVLSIYASQKGRSWVAWTPEGFYDASPDGEKLIGWHLNRNRTRAADFYPAARFRELYHDPAAITLALDPARADTPRALDQKAARLAEIRQRMQAGLPPQITLRSVSEAVEAKGPVARLTYTLRTPSGEPVQRVRVLIDGRPSGVEQQIPAPTADPAAAKETESSPYTVNVPLPPGEVEIEIGLIAESQGAISELARTRLRDRTSSNTSPTKATTNGVANNGGNNIKPRLYALVVGVGTYQHEGINPLDFPAKDARDFAAALKGQRGRLYREVDVRLLENAAATREGVLDGLDWLRRQVTANDLAVVFFAGHGVNDQTGRYYFVPANADPARLRSTAVPNGDITEALQALPAKVLAFLDTCHAGNVLGSGKQRNLSIGLPGDINRLVNELTSAENGVVVFASSTGRETSQESAEWNNGVFTKALVEGLGGKADFNHDGAVSLNELNLYVADRVKQLTNGDQHANMIRPDSIRDFPFAVMK
ncbi:MAG: caspase family protein [Sterolibacterium sp.]|nr:caspase family protein [Sterolibacterium sp.]